MIARCTAHDRADRYASVEEIAAALKRGRLFRRWYVGLAVMLAAVIIYILLWRNTTEAPSPDVTTTADTMSLPAMNIPQQDERDTIVTQAPAQPGPESALQPVLQPEVTPPAPAANSTERLRAEVRNTVLPHFNATVGAMPDSAEPGGQQWADACSALEPLLEQSLKSLIASHPNISMETVAKEFNDYVNALMTLKMNQAKK